jgi:hypothetical protein
MGQENNLRQKAVNLFYLIFLILIFSFIPSGFVDTTYHTNTSLDLISAEVNQLNNTSTKYFLHLLRNEPELLMQTKDKLIRIESITKNTTSYIDELKLKLIEVDKMDDFGYFKFGKEEGTSNSVMIYGKQADSLFNKLHAYKKTIAEYLTPKDVEEINKILPLPTYELTSDGNYVLAAEYYFQRTPLSVAVLNLSHFKSRVERIKVYAHQKIVKQILFENASILPFENMKLAKDETFTDILGTSSLQEFFETIEPNGFLANQIAAGNELRSRYYIESLTDTIHPMGRAIQYYAYFDTTGTRSLKIQVSSDDGTQYFGLSKPGSFYFYPSSKGRYTFTFKNGKKITTKKITVIDADPIIQNTRLSTLYIGLDNPLNIKTSEFDENDNLTAEITDGQVIRKGEIFYARVFSKGITKIKIYAQMPYGRIKVAEKSFVIRELHKPIPSINGIISGGIVKKANISQFKVMTLQTDEYLIDEEVYIADFEFMLLYNKFSAVVQPIKNVGSSFNDQVLKGLQRAKVGDVIIFTNIRTLSSRGVETIIPTLTLNVI